MAELADAYGLGPYGEILEGSSPFPSIFAAAFGGFLIFPALAYSGLRPLAVLLASEKIKNTLKILAKILLHRFCIQPTLRRRYVLF